MKECFVLIEPLNASLIMKHTAKQDLPPPRQSQRVLERKQALQLLEKKPETTKPHKTPKKTQKKIQQVSRAIKKRVSKSATKPVKSILKVGSMRSRSKSVTFDPTIDADVPSLPWLPRSVDYNRSRSKSILSDASIVTPIKSVRRKLFAAQRDLDENDSNELVQQTSDDQRNEVESHVEVESVVGSGLPNDSNEVVQQTPNNQRNEIESNVGSGLPNDLVAHYVDVQTEDPTTVFEARIKALVESNHTKINRIKELVADKAGMLKDIDTLHNMNRSMAATIDAFREDDNTLENEVGTLRQRIDDINRENFELKEQIQRMKLIMGTYSAKVLAEHNYSM